MQFFYYRTGNFLIFLDKFFYKKQMLHAKLEQVKGGLFRFCEFRLCPWYASMGDIWINLQANIYVCEGIGKEQW